MENVIGQVSILSSLKMELGESPVWDNESRVCYWVDIEGKILFRFNWQTKELRQYVFEKKLSLIVPGKNEMVLLAFQGGIASFNINSGDLTCLNDLGIDWTDMRCNDGACDNRGRLWMGTMQLDCREGEGTLYCIEHNVTVTKKIDRVSISNGIAWSADNTRLYYTDSSTRQVVCYKYDEATGNITFEKIAIRVPTELGLPDGIAMDAEGMLWVALWGGFGVSRWDVHTGRLVCFISVPVPQVSSCAFAGERLDQLVITTARKGMSDYDLLQYPKSGHVFIVNAGVRGLPRFYANI